MNYLTFFVVGVISGLLLSLFLRAHSSKKEESLATKEDIEKITKKLEEIKYMYKDSNNLAEAEKEFFSNADEIDNLPV